MTKRTILLSLTLLLAATLLLCACRDNTHTDNPETTTDATTTAPAETKPPYRGDGFADKYNANTNGLANTPGTFTDRITEAQLMEAIRLGDKFNADPLLYNLIRVADLTRENITVYSEMNGGMLTPEIIDGLFLEGKAMREALRGEYTIMAGDFPYTIYELASFDDAELKTLGIPDADLRAFCEKIVAASETLYESLGDEIWAFLAKYTTIPE